MGLIRFRDFQQNPSGGGGGEGGNDSINDSVGFIKTIFDIFYVFDAFFCKLTHQLLLVSFQKVV